jgi:hypothetical protein
MHDASLRGVGSLESRISSSSRKQYADPERGSLAHHSSYLRVHCFDLDLDCLMLVLCYASDGLPSDLHLACFWS